MFDVAQITRDEAGAPPSRFHPARPFPEPEADTVIATPLRAVAADTPIATPSGPRAADRLQAGDRVTNRNGVAVQIREVRTRHLSFRDLHRHPAFVPIRIEPGALPWTDLDQPLLLSPDQHLPLSGAEAACLVPARALCDGGTIRPVIPEEGVTFVELICDEPQLLNAGGLWIETGEFVGARRSAQHAAQVPVSDRRVFTPL